MILVFKVSAWSLVFSYKGQYEGQLRHVHICKRCPSPNLYMWASQLEIATTDVKCELPPFNFGWGDYLKLITPKIEETHLTMMTNLKWSAIDEKQEETNNKLRDMSHWSPVWVGDFHVQVFHLYDIDYVNTQRSFSTQLQFTCQWHTLRIWSLHRQSRAWSCVRIVQYVDHIVCQYFK